jgi:plasmid stabilization system protein ParE
VTLQLVVSLEAQADIAEAVTWLGGVSPSLPPRFGEELEIVYASIREHPKMYSNVYKSFRRALLHSFPYSVFYVVEPFVVLILGVIHQSRDESLRRTRSTPDVPLS